MVHKHVIITALALGFLSTQAFARGEKRLLPPTLPAFTTNTCAETLSSQENLTAPQKLAQALITQDERTQSTRPGAKGLLQKDAWVNYLQTGQVPNLTGDTFQDFAVHMLNVASEFRINLTTKKLNVPDLEKDYGKPQAKAEVMARWQAYDGGATESSPLDNLFHDLGHAYNTYKTFWKNGENGADKEASFQRWVAIFWERVENEKQNSVASSEFLRAFGFLVFRDMADLYMGAWSGPRPVLQFIDLGIARAFPGYSNVSQIRRLKDPADLGNQFPVLKVLPAETLMELNRDAVRTFAELTLEWMEAEGGLEQVAKYFPNFVPTNNGTHSIVGNDRELVGYSAQGLKILNLEKKLKLK